MKSKYSDIIRDGIAYYKEQIKKLENEIERMQKLKSNGGSVSKINEIIKWDKKLISDFKAEIVRLKKRL